MTQFSGFFLVPQKLLPVLDDPNLIPLIDSSFQHKDATVVTQLLLQHDPEHVFLKVSCTD